MARLHTSWSALATTLSSREDRRPRSSPCHNPRRMLTEPTAHRRARHRKPPRCKCQAEGLGFFLLPRWRTAVCGLVRHSSTCRIRGCTSSDSRALGGLLMLCRPAPVPLLRERILAPRRMGTHKMRVVCPPSLKATTWWCKRPLSNLTHYHPRDTEAPWGPAWTTSVRAIRRRPTT